MSHTYGLLCGHKTTLRLPHVAPGRHLFCDRCQDWRLMEGVPPAPPTTAPASRAGCRNGHSPKEIRLDKHGFRRCKQCRREWRRQHNQLDPSVPPRTQPLTKTEVWEILDASPPLHLVAKRYRVGRATIEQIRSGRLHKDVHAAWKAHNRQRVHPQAEEVPCPTLGAPDLT